MASEKKVADLDAINTVSWVLMGYFWRNESYELAMAFAAVIGITGITVFAYLPWSFADLTAAAALNAWLAADVFWLLGDIYSHEWLLAAADWCSLACIGILVVGLVRTRASGEMLGVFLERFRRFRIRF